MRRRLVVGAVILATWSLAIEARLVYLQVIRHGDLSAKARNQQTGTVETAANRGDILDRNGRVLAYSVEAESIYAVPSEIVNVDNGQLQVLTDGRLDESPSFAPNGAQIIYATRVNGRGVLASVSSDGRFKTQIASVAGNVREPVWGPFPRP